MSSKLLATVALCAASLAPVCASAAEILNTLNPLAADGIESINATTAPGNQGTPAFNINALGPVGQSFMLSQDTRELSVTAFFTSFGGAFDLEISIVEGAGVDGDEVGSQSFNFTSDEVEGRTIRSRTADFSSLGDLTAGVYTVVFEATNSGALLGGETPGVVTANTQSFDEDGIFNFGTNFSQEFGVLVEGEAVPVPGAALIFLSGIVGLSLARRKA
ncbi:MAG: hypothetical protein AAFR65_12290 [Pseudomonadota bacterium]